MTVPPPGKLTRHGSMRAACNPGAQWMAQFEEPANYNRGSLEEAWDREDRNRRTSLKKKAQTEANNQAQEQARIAQEEAHAAAVMKADLLARRCDARERRQAVRQAKHIYEEQRRQKQRSADDWVVAKAMKKLALEEEQEAWKKYRAAARREASAKEWETLDQELAAKLHANQAHELGQPFIRQEPVAHGDAVPKTFSQGASYVRGLPGNAYGQTEHFDVAMIQPRGGGPNLKPLAGGLLGGRGGVFQQNRVTLDPEKLKTLSAHRGGRDTKPVPAEIMSNIRTMIGQIPRTGTLCQRGR